MESHGGMTISTLQDYIQRTRCLNRSPRANIGRAPRNPFLLLAVIVLIQEGGINENKIHLSEDLIVIFIVKPIINYTLL